MNSRLSDSAYILLLHFRTRKFVSEIDSKGLRRRSMWVSALAGLRSSSRYSTYVYFQRRMTRCGRSGILRIKPLYESVFLLTILYAAIYSRRSDLSARPFPRSPVTESASYALGPKDGWAGPGRHIFIPNTPSPQGPCWQFLKNLTSSEKINTFQNIRIHKEKKKKKKENVSQFWNQSAITFFFR